MFAAIGIDVWCDKDLYVWSRFGGRSATNKENKMLLLSPLYIDSLSGTLEMVFANKSL